MDNISILLTNIRNALAVGHKKVYLPYTSLNESLLAILADKGLVSNIKIVERGKEEKKNKVAQKRLQAVLKYNDKLQKVPSIGTLTQVSKPGRRVYKKASEIHQILKGKAFGIYSTSKGLKTDVQVMKEKIGGEYICEIWQN